MPGIFLKSCERMDELADGTISLVVTSPPYWNAIDYDQHVDDASQWFRTRRGEPYAEYLDWLMRCFGECLRVTRPGGYCAVVVGTVLLNGKHVPLPMHLVGRMEEIGWQFHQDIIWYKVTGGVKRAGVVIQHPYPGYYYPNIMTEYILIFRKPGGKRPVPSQQREESAIPIDEVFVKEIANNIWHVAPVPPRQYDHPCPFPEEIPYRLISLYTNKGEAVLDPFLGIGTTAKVARALGRDWYGYEVKEKYYQLALERLETPLHLRDALISEFRKLPLAAAKPVRRQPAPRRKSDNKRGENNNEDDQHERRSAGQPFSGHLQPAAD